MVDLEGAGDRLPRLYTTGATIFRPFLRQIPERFPDIDAMLIHLGGTRLLGVTVTMDGRQGNDLLELVRPGVTLPIHYDDYRVFRSPLADFLAIAVHRRQMSLIQPIVRGQTVALATRPQKVDSSLATPATVPSAFNRPRAVASP